MIGSYPYHLSVMPKRLCESPRTTHLKKTFPFLRPSLAVSGIVVSLRRSGSSQILELFNELLVPNMPFEPFKYLSNIVHDNGIVTFGIPINGVPNDARILHVVSFFIPIKNVSVLRVLIVRVDRFATRQPTGH